jgi:uncharacterized protein (DUF2336 family)
LAGKPVASAVSNFGASAKSKLANPAISGAPEDQLRGPLETFMQDLAEICGLGGAIQLVGETTLAHLKTRPDFAATVSNALVGFIEVKAPGKGADPRRFDDPHDKDHRDMELRGLGQAGRLAMVQLSPSRPHQAHHRRQASAFAARRHPTEGLDSRIHDRPS